jgi:hypothetical protein
MRGEQGDYVLAFTGAGWLSLMAAFLAMRIGRTNRKRRLTLDTPIVPIPDTAASPG